MTAGGGKRGRVSCASAPSPRARSAASSWCRRAVGLAGPIAAADVAVGAAGVTAYELACAGVPAALVAVAPEQERVARTLAGRGRRGHGRRRRGAGRPPGGPGARDGRSRSAGRRHGRRLRRLPRARRAAGDPARRGAAARRCATARRRAADSAALLDWRNDPAGAGGLAHHPRDRRRRARALARRACSPTPSRTLLVAETRRARRARCASTSTGDEAEISVVVAPERRGEGLGARIVREASELMLAAAAGAGAGARRGRRGQRALRPGVPERRASRAAGGRCIAALPRPRRSSITPRHEPSGRQDHARDRRHRLVRHALHRDRARATTTRSRSASSAATS